jgi:hypothetical protein
MTSDQKKAIERYKKELLDIKREIAFNRLFVSSMISKRTKRINELRIKIALLNNQGA